VVSFQSDVVINAKPVAEAALQGDLVVEQILSLDGAHIGIAIAGLVNISTPSMVIKSGRVSQNSDIILEPIRQVVNRRSLPAASRVVHITTAVLGRPSSSNWAAIQALAIALHRILDRKEVISAPAA
jgi:predicted NBD/HSP70 family sugar kinase